MSTQTQKEREEVFNTWVQRYGDRVCIDLRNIDNITLIGQAVAKFDPLKLHNIVETVAQLDLRGFLVPKTKGSTVVVVEKPARKLSKPDRLQQVGLGGTSDRFITTEFDRAEKTKPKASEAELVATATADLQINKIMNDTISVISRYRGSNHSQTAKRQEQLMGVFNKFKSQVKTPDDAMKMLNTIKAQVDTWDNSSIR